MRWDNIIYEFGIDLWDLFLLKSRKLERTYCDGIKPIMELDLYALAIPKFAIHSFFDP